MNIRQLRKRMEFWQQLLNIGEWKVTVRWGTDEEMLDEESHECRGLNYIDVEELESTILLKKGEREDTLVHEIMHIVNDGHKNKNKYDALEERAINRTTAALMKLAYPEQV